MSKNFTHNGVFEPDFDVSKDITGEEYIGFNKYIELPKGKSVIGQSLIIVLTKNLNTRKCYCDLIIERDGNHTSISNAVSITEPAFQTLTGLAIIDNDSAATTSGHTGHTPALPYGNIIEKGFYYE